MSLSIFRFSFLDYVRIDMENTCNLIAKPIKRYGRTKFTFDNIGFRESYLENF